jgi:hypothetical protein
MKNAKMRRITKQNDVVLELLVMWAEELTVGKSEHLGKWKEQRGNGRCE